MLLRIGPGLAALAVVACAGGGSARKSPDAAIEEEPVDARPRFDSRVPIADAGFKDAPGPDSRAGGVDATGAPDAAAAIDAHGADAVGLAPPMPIVTRGGSVTLSACWAGPAPAEGVTVTLASDSAAVTVPTSVNIPAAAGCASFDAQGITANSSANISARVGTGPVTQLPVRVVPALARVTGPANVLGGKKGTFTITLESAASGGAVPVALSTNNPSLVTLPETVMVPPGTDSVTFEVSGVKLGVASLVATVANAHVDSRVRVFGLLFSEVLYDLPSSDDMQEWIELYNATSSPVDTAGMTIQVAGVVQPVNSFVPSFFLSGTIPAGGCVVVGGPLGNDGDAGPKFSYFVAAPFDPSLGNAGTSASDAGDGIQLVTPTGVIDNVIYGRNNDSGILDEDGNTPTAADVADASEGRTIERVAVDVNGAWVTDKFPNPGDCSAIAK